MASTSSPPKKVSPLVARTWTGAASGLGARPARQQPIDGKRPQNSVNSELKRYVEQTRAVVYLEYPILQLEQADIEGAPS